MSALAKLRKEVTAADLAAVESLLGEIHDAKSLSRLSLESRRTELHDELQKFAQHDDDTHASAALFFGGRPVVGSHGIASDFGGRALQSFQELITKQLADETVGLGQRGIVPQRDAARLHITNIVRGSFGFLLEEVDSQERLVQSQLALTMEKVTDLIASLGSEDEEHYRAILENLDPRVLAQAKDFFTLLDQADATFRLVQGSHDFAFSRSDVHRATERATTTRVSEDTERVEGILLGVLPDAHQFEFELTNGAVIRGKVTREFGRDLRALSRELHDKEALATLLVRRVYRASTVVRESFTLAAIKPA